MASGASELHRSRFRIPSSCCSELDVGSEIGWVVVWVFLNIRFHFLEEDDP